MDIKILSSSTSWHCGKVPKFFQLLKNYLEERKRKKEFCAGGWDI